MEILSPSGHLHLRCRLFAYPFALWIVDFGSVFLCQTSGFWILTLGSAPPRPVLTLRPASFNLTDFGGISDDPSLNTAAFDGAVAAIARLAGKGGGQLNFGAGIWLTAPFNLTSHMTLFLAQGAFPLFYKILALLCPEKTTLMEPHSTAARNHPDPPGATAPRLRWPIPATMHNHPSVRRLLRVYI